MVALVERERERELLTPLGAVDRAALADLLRALLLAVESLEAPVGGIESGRRARPGRVTDAGSIR